MNRSVVFARRRQCPPNGLLGPRESAARTTARDRYIRFHCTRTAERIAAGSICETHAMRPKMVLFCSLAVLDPRVGHAMDVLSPFIHVLCHSD